MVTRPSSSACRLRFLRRRRRTIACSETAAAAAAAELDCVAGGGGGDPSETALILCSPPLTPAQILTFPSLFKKEETGEKKTTVVN